MWLDDEGVAHTISLPPSENTMYEELVSAIAVLSQSESRELLALIEDAQESIAEELASIEVPHFMVGERVPSNVLEAINWRLVLSPPFDLNPITSDPLWSLDLLGILDELMP